MIHHTVGSSANRKKEVHAALLQHFLFFMTCLLNHYKISKILKFWLLLHKKCENVSLN